MKKDKKIILSFYPDKVTRVSIDTMAEKNHRTRSGMIGIIVDAGLKSLKKKQKRGLL